MEDLTIRDDLVVPGALLAFSAVRASGPGGQNVNKVSSKVDLRFEFARWPALDDATRARLVSLPGVRLDAEGRLIVVCQEYRDQPRNLAAARERVASLVLAALVRPKKRKARKPSAAARARRVEAKRRQGDKKASRREMD
jgi:ribosome-associated protein